MDAAIDRKNADQSLAVEAWVARIDAAIGSAVDKAHAHAVLACNDTLRRTPDGRRSIRKASRSPSYAAAVADMGKLLERLAGPSSVSLDGLLRDARSDLYRRAFTWWHANIPAEFREPNPPGAAGMDDARRMVLHGMDVRTEIQPKFDAAGRNLLAALEVASREGTPASRSASLLKGWADQARSAIGQACRIATGDAAVAIETMASYDATKPEFHPRDTNTEG